MDMNRSFNLRKEDQKQPWRLIDAKGRVLGRMATEIANALRGKDKPEFTPHADAGDYVVVINARHIVLTGNKWEGKEYQRYSGYLGNMKVFSAREMMAKDPAEIITLAVQRMLPKNRLSRDLMRKLRVYADETHPHEGQLS